MDEEEEKEMEKEQRGACLDEEEGEQRSAVVHSVSNGSG